MNAGNDHKCAAVSAEDLVLFAYGETDDPSIAKHVAGCPDCRAFIADLEKVRHAAQRAGALEPGLAVIAGLKQKAARQAGAVRTAPRQKERGRAWPRWVFAMAAVFIAAAGLMIYQYQERHGAWHEARETRGVPAYLAGVGAQLTEMEGLVGGSDDADAGGLEIIAVAETEAGDSVAGVEGGFSLDPGGWDLIVEPGPNVDDLEVAMNDLESQVDLLGDYDAQDGSVEKGWSGG
ncbi:MAG TPA: hypothetical protein VM658_03485, partial [bacterium]|nr:hypothetical protein [bacterium]